MRNEDLESTKGKIVSSVRGLPYFMVENLNLYGVDQNYLRVILSRLTRRKEIIRLKKGFYTTKSFVEKIEKENNFSSFLEFLSTKIYFPSYLSLDYVLYENNILTEIPKNFTLITKNKTITFSNDFGVFIYHKIKDELFLGFEIRKIDNFLIYKSSLAKALFDFLYLRKNIILSRQMLMELRLNLDNFKEKTEFKKYVDMEGSKKMKEIFSLLFE